MDIRRFRHQRQQRRDSGSNLPPLPQSAMSQVSSSPTSQLESFSTAPLPPPRRQSKISRFKQGRRPKQEQHGDEIEMKNLISIDPVTSPDEDISIDDYSSNISKTCTPDSPTQHNSKNSPTSFASVISVDYLRLLLKNFLKLNLSVASTLILILSAIIIFLFVFRRPLYIILLRFMQIPSGIYTRHGRLYIGKETRYHIKGVSWFGMEEEGRVPRGLDKISINQLLDFLKEHRFNAIRLPLSLENLKLNPEIHNGISTFHNPDLGTLNYIDVIRVIVRKAAEKDILILLDMHRLKNADVASSGVWYKDDAPEEQLEEMWLMLANEFGEEWNILGADLYNEPWNATWNNDPNDPNNWKRMAESLGNKVHAVCPTWLLFVQGVGNRAGNCSTGCFWAENLRAMHDLPPAIEKMDKVVLSPHVYGPAVFMQDYFKTENFTEEMPPIWDDHFGEASNATGMAVVIGEWGGTFQDDDEHWQRKFFNYIMEKELSFFYWCLNPEGADTGGLLADDWKTPRAEKLTLIDNAPATSVGDYREHFRLFRS